MIYQVSPENAADCLELTRQSRMLSNLHANHEDKLQIKGCLFFSCKTSLAVCEQHLADSKTSFNDSREEQESITCDNHIDNLSIESETSKRDALKSANLNDSSPNKFNLTSNNSTNEPSKRRNLNVNERAKRIKLNETVESPKTTPLKKTRKEHGKTLKMKS